MTATDVYYDPYDYVIDADPYPVWRRLRDEAPVYYNEKHDFWALSRYDDVLRGLLDHESFVSSHGIMLEIITDEPYGIPMMIMMDPPEHTKLRKLVARAFTPRRIADLEVKIAALANEFLDSVEGEDEFDYVEHFAGLLPPTVILSLVGYPEGHAKEFKELTDQSLHVDEGATTTHGQKNRQIVNENGEINNEAFAMIPELMEMRLKDPQDDLLTGLVHAEIEDDGRDAQAHARGDPRVHAADLVGGHRDRGPVARLRRGHAPAVPRSTPAAARRPVAHEQRGRGAHAVRGAVTHAVALGGP